METIKIHKLEIENVKRVKAVCMKPTEEGLTIIGGNNNQGKTSVLDSIAWVLGGNRFKPSEAQRRESVIPPNLKIVLNNGLVVERKGKNADLKVTDPNGKKYGQSLLDSFVEELALDLPKFMQASNKEKANTLLQIIGVGDKLLSFEKEEQEIYYKRHSVGRIADQKEKFAQEQVFYPEAPKEIVSASELIKQQQEVLARNGENQKHRDNLKELIQGKKRTEEEYKILEEQILSLEERLIKLKNEKGMKGSLLKEYDININLASKTVEQLKDKSTEELEKNLEKIEEINIKVRANLDKEKAEDDAKEYREEYRKLTNDLEKVRQAKIDLLKNADLPLPDLSIEDGELVYKKDKWDTMSGSDQLKVATAIVRKLKPQCGFVLMDKLEQMDVESLNDFGEWLKNESLQVIATRVSKGDECSIIIEDGYVVGQVEPKQSKAWNVGEF